MTPLEAKAELQKLSNEIGPKCTINTGLQIASWMGDVKALYAYIYPEGIHPGRFGEQPPQFNVQGDTFEEIIESIRAMWSDRASEFHGKKIRRMALEIIRQTADLEVGCTDAGLRAEGFTQADIDRYGPEATTAADKMAGNGPFTITVTEKANAA